MTRSKWVMSRSAIIGELTPQDALEERWGGADHAGLPLQPSVSVQVQPVAPTCAKCVPSGSAAQRASITRTCLSSFASSIAEHRGAGAPQRATSRWSTDNHRGRGRSTERGGGIVMGVDHRVP